MLAEKGVEAKAASRENLNSAYRRFMSEGDADRKNEAGKDLIRAIFGGTAIAEDSIRRSPATGVGTSARAGGATGGFIERSRHLRDWVKTTPRAPEGDWYKDFGSFILCGSGEMPKTVLAESMQPFGEAIR